MFTVYRMALTPARKLYRVELLFTHENGDFGAKLLCADLESGESHIG